MAARHPLVDLRSLSVPSVRVAHTVAVLAGVGMYFLFSLAIRYVQTPVSTGYGQGRTVLAAGLILAPFSVASLAVNRLTGVIRRRMDGRWLMPLGCGAFAAAMVAFGSARSEVWQLVVVMVLAGDRAWRRRQAPRRAVTAALSRRVRTGRWPVPRRWRPSGSTPADPP